MTDTAVVNAIERMRDRLHTDLCDLLNYQAQILVHFREHATVDPPKPEETWYRELINGQWLHRRFVDGMIVQQHFVEDCKPACPLHLGSKPDGD